MHAELIAIGAEIVLGEIVDTNSAHIARALRDVGVEVRWIAAVGDDEERIAEVVRQALQRSPLVITTGGLGPTVDDPTREAIARACGHPLEFRPELWEQIQERFRRYGRPASPNNRKQAHAPQGALALENPVGTAPCFVVETAESVLIALPGVPREMEYMLTHAVLPYLRGKFNLSGVILAKVLRTVGIGESLIDEKIGELELLTNPAVGLAAHPGQTDIRITAMAPSEAEALALIAPVEARVRAALGDFIYAEGKASVEEVVAGILAERGMTVAVAEAGTHDLMAKRLATLPQAGQILRGSALIPDFDGTAQMHAESIRRQQNVDWGLAAIINPTADPPHIEIALAGAEHAETRTFGYGGPPASAAVWVTTWAFNLLRLALLNKRAIGTPNR